MINRLIKKFSGSRFTFLLHQKKSYTYRENQKFVIPTFDDLTDVKLPPVIRENSTSLFYNQENRSRWYLGPYEHFASSIEGYFSVNFSRPIVCLPTASTDLKKFLAVYFIVDPTCPVSFLQQRAIKALFNTNDTSRWNWPVNIWGIRTSCYTSQGNYSHVNILGANVLERGEIRLELIYKRSILNRKFLVQRWASIDS